MATGGDLWLCKDGSDGSWELAPAENATELQSDFLVDSTLRLVMHALQKDTGASDILLDCTRSFAGVFHPLQNSIGLCGLLTYLLCAL